eukprot:TRINITY_DN4149_c0_g1_i1.p1 TRINITY_DN4149_c0_g1~~TRINITY_DN4149_c0_g1_i1.p1  ORF type:complete len:499 (+),score=91.10 TRINITY_DN4149_c0_g1_i1:72-1499(+)
MSSIPITPPPPPAFFQSLSERFGKRCRRDERQLKMFSKDWSYHSSQPPFVVVAPETEAEVQFILALCNQYKVPIIPSGSRTSLEGQVLPVHSGLCLNMENMDKIISIHSEDLDVVVQPGISFRELNRALKKHSLWFPLDAGPNATIGGMVSTNASGTKAVRYGPMRDNVLNLKAILVDGTVVRTAQRARKTSAGYDLTHLLIGSEGTLALVTEVTLRVRRIPAHITAALCSFETVKSAANVVMEMIQMDFTIGMVEFLDELMIKATNMHFSTNFEEKPTLYFEFSAGTLSQAKEQEQIARDLCTKYGGSDFQFKFEEKEREDLWKIRKAALMASKELKPDAEVWTTDVCVPISRLAECIVKTKEDIAKSFLPAPIVGHVGDGSIHVFIQVDTSNPAELAEAKRINSRMIDRAIKMEGTCTGEHGVGIGKRSYLESELGPGALVVMRRLKDLFDPNGILNPGKILFDDPPKLKANL